MILGAVAAAERDLTLLATARPGVVRVASFASAAAAILPLAFARFRTLAPDVDLELVSANPEEGIAMLGSDGVDAAVITEVPGEDLEFPGVHTAAGLRRRVLRRAARAARTGRRSPGAIRCAGRGAMGGQHRNEHLPRRPRLPASVPSRRG